jgi:hypothetical protein
MKKHVLLAVFIYLTAIFGIQAQDIPAKPVQIISGKFVGISQPLRDIPAMSKEDYLLMEAKAKKKAKNTPWPLPEYPFTSSSLPTGEDAVWQKNGNPKSFGTKAPIQYFEGQSSPYYPPDCNGAAGPSHYMQTVNSSYAIYNKTGTLVAGPTAMNTLFGNVPGANYNDGDPVILYDEQANRWVAVEFSVSGTNDYMLFAVSTTNDPTGTWYQYSFDVVDMPDYEKIAVWQDGYYMGTNTQPTTGNDIYVFDRAQMLIGGTAQMVAFDNPYRPGTGVVVVPPVDNDGPFAPAGTPGTFIAFNDDGVGGGADELWLYELDVDWTTPANSTFNRTQQIGVSPFDSQFSNGWDNLTQPGTTMKLCAISTVIMNVPQYRNFGTYQSIVCCHTVDVDNTDHAGVRWYELRKTPPSTTWVLRQQGTYAPDANSRWMGSIAMNGDNKIAIGYSITGTTEYPGIRYAGQSTAGYTSASGVMDVPEVVAHSGTNYQYTYNRWGDYSSMSIDPSDDQTFWFTTEYIGASEARKTKIVSFKIGNSPIVETQNATAITSVSATLNGSVNPNGLATTYYFEWGLTASYGNSTTTTSAGSGSAAISVTANITGLIANTPYHFRLVATNSDGSSNGSDFIFIAGGVTLTTTPVTAITLNTASSGGNITADGGSTITARGVCWDASANPTIALSHTTNGGGIGVFTSAVTGLSPNSTYHIRAYATNATGTFYGDDLVFTTLCSVYTLPFNETFTNTVIPNCWTQSDHQGNGQVWAFGTITGQSPNPALTGNYAYLNSDAYGSASSQNADLISPTLDLTAYSTINLAFSHYFKSYTGSSGTVSYSIDNGATWTSLATFTATSATNPIAFSQAVNAAAGQATVKFKWNYTGTYGYYWGIDNIAITGSAASMPVVQTVAASAIGTTTATSGGNVTSAGSSSVTARGVCWGNTANPIITGDHTTNGTGIGTFTSSITGLIPSTTYHIRAYATNSSGTSYGDDLTFVTPCNAISVFPWLENFENAGSIPNCWSQSYVTTPGLNWVFINGNGGSNPATSHSGTYDACLKDATQTDNKTMLITPAFDLTNAGVAQLKFWHTQQFWSPDQDLLSVYYKTSAGGNWTLLASYTSDVATWTQESIVLPNSSNDYYIAFEGNAKYGYGVCVDDVSIESACSYPLQPGAISGPTSVSVGQTGVSYSIATIANALSYAWTLPSGATGTSTSNSILVDYGISAVSGDITVKGVNACGDGPISSLTITVLPLKVFQVKLFLESLYAGSGTLLQAQGSAGPQYPAGIADKVNIELHNNASPYGLVYTNNNADLQTNGTVMISDLPGTTAGQYYIAVKHRNSIQTWSAQPFNFSGSGPFSYDFTTSASKAYGNNLKDMLDGSFAIYAGDADQDGGVGVTDMGWVDNQSSIFGEGYIPEDINGDGSVGVLDMSIIDNNSSAFVAAIIPGIMKKKIQMYK